MIQSELSYTRYQIGLIDILKQLWTGLKNPTTVLEERDHTPKIKRRFEVSR
ncbi:MAG: hypothetical protein WB511_04905 [Nitrososphaeraceae archaeon]